MTVSTDVGTEPYKPLEGSVYELIMDRQSMDCPLCGGPYPWMLRGPHVEPGQPHIWTECDHNIELRAPTAEDVGNAPSVEIDWTLSVE